MAGDTRGSKQISVATRGRRAQCQRSNSWSGNPGSPK